MILTATELQNTTQIGNKARSLIEMSRAGFNVPRTWVIPESVYREFIRGENPLESFDWERWLLSFAPGARLAVRSSSSVEDGAGASFAGLFETYLDIGNAGALREAVYKCWSSARSERVERYARNQNIDIESISMSVVIQDYIEPDFSGVAFTVNPLSGDDREMLAEICVGSGEKLVSGQVNPARYRISWMNDGEILSQENPLSQVRPADLALLQAQLRQVQALKGRPQDVEFAFRGGKLFLLQSRDITRIQIAPELGEWTTADLRDGGVSAGVTTPLMWSFYRMCIQESMSEYFSELKLFNPKKNPAKFAEVFYGRPYWNLGFVKQIMKKVPGFVERNFDEDLSVPPAYEGDGVTTPFSLAGLIRVLPTIFALYRGFRRQIKTDDIALAQSRALEDYYKKTDFSKLADGRVAKMFDYLCRTEYPFVEKNYFKTIYNTSNAKLELKVGLERLSKLDPEIRYNDLVAGLDRLDVIQPVNELWRLRDLVAADSGLAAALEETRPGQERDFIARAESEFPAFASQLRIYIDTFYYRSESELDISVPRWSEDPSFVIQSLKTLVKNGNDERRPNTFEEKKGLLHQRALERADRVFREARLRGFFQKRAFRKNLERLRHYAWLREEMRDRSTRTYFFLRRFALECGERLTAKMPAAFKTRDDVFLLEFEEIVQALNGNCQEREIARLIELRRLYRDSYRNYKNPNEIGARWNRNPKGPAQLQPSSATTWRGIACSTGLARGRARVITTLKDAHRVKKGDILIAPFTDPGWTPLFSVVSAVVTETGGLLSHAALISREYAMPAVLNIPGVTGLVRDGQEIIVDGGAGTVQLVDPS